jgi:hypothetical protein
VPKATKHLKNTNPTGDVWNPLVGSVAAGEVIEVAAEIADKLAEQVGNWLIVDKPNTKES